MIKVLDWLASLCLLILAIPITGLMFPIQWPFDPEKRSQALAALNFLIKDSDGIPSDGLEEALIRLRQPGRTFHDWKNVLFEWIKLNVKFASHFLCALITWPWVVFLFKWRFF